jgi:predicted nucleic acid-binding protein
MRSSRRRVIRERRGSALMLDGQSRSHSMKVYLDNVIVSALVRDDLASPEEQRALKLLQEHHNFRKLEIVTSRESWREQDRTRCEKTREELRSSRDRTAVVSEDHKLLGFNIVDLGYHGFVSSPLITDIVDEAMFAALKAAGLKSGDARHLMYALCNGCDRFVTTDPDFLNRCSAIEAAYPKIRIVKPSKMLEEMEKI